MRNLAIFDLDNTLIDRLAAFHRWAAEFVSSLGGTPSDLAWLVALDADGSLPMDRFFSAVRVRFALPDPADLLWARYRARLPHLVECPPEVLAALAALRESGWLLAVATNGRTDLQTAKLHHSGLSKVLHGWAISETEGTAKPDPLLLHRAAAHCGTTLTPTTWMIGDTLETDITAAHTTALPTIWLDRQLPHPT
ncbi:HAD family hydrolase, partial [Actinocorallia lasiicapitis]